MSGPSSSMPSCQGVWSSRDPVGAEQLDVFRDVGRQAVEAGMEPSRAVLGMKTAHGVLATAQGARWDALSPHDLVVVMDVDPVKGVMLLAGPGEASCWAGVLFLVMRHRTEVKAALFQAEEGGGSPKAGHVRDSEVAAPLEATQSRGWGFQEGAVAATGPGHGAMVDQAYRALEGLKEDNVVQWARGGSLVAGETLTELIPALQRQGPLQ